VTRRADAESDREEDDGDFANHKLEAEIGDTWFLGGRRASLSSITVR
jgi:hypothetical protein